VQVSAALLRGAGVQLDEAAVADALELLEPFRDDAADAARLALSRVESGADSHKRTVEQLAPVEAIEADFGANQEWHALHDNCFTARHDGFEYRLCAFASFSQDTRSLGKYKGWVARSASTDTDDNQGRVHPMEMAFDEGDGGEGCNGTPRSSRVTFECGEEDKLLAVEEPATCVYSARFSTPSACTTDAVREGHAKLVAAAADAGLSYEPDTAVKSLLGL